MKTVNEYTQSNILVIPQSLFAMKDVSALAHHQDAAIFLKMLDQDLTDIEFYTNTPCIIYIEEGREVITNNENKAIELFEGSAIFLPQGLNLHSDYVQTTSSLKAYLAFFDDEVTRAFLSSVKTVSKPGAVAQNYCVAEDSGVLKHYFQSLNTLFSSGINYGEFLRLKLKELLHLFAWLDQSKALVSLLANSSRTPLRRNLYRLMEKEDILHLSISDLAHLSGRSLSSFNRDFRAIYDMPPSKWLQEKRLMYSRELLKSESMSVTDVALKVGYENMSHFIKVFKEKFGVTPKQIKHLI